MANTFDTVLVPRILAQALRVLRQRLGFAEYLHKDYSGAAGQLGDVVSISVPTAMATYPISPAAVAPALVDTVIAATTVTIANWYGSRFHMTQMEALKFREQDIIPGQIGEAAYAIAKVIEDSVWANYFRAYNQVGAAGDSIFGGTTPTVNTVSDVKKTMDFMGVPEEDRVLLCGYDEANAARKCTDIKRFDHRGFALGDGVSVSGHIGEVYGLQVVESGRRISRTNGTWTTCTANGASLAGVTSIPVTTAGTLAGLKGDIITFASDPLNQPYSLQADLSGAGTATVKPALKTALSGGEAITLQESAGTGEVINLALQREGAALVMRVPGDHIDGAPVLGPSWTMEDPGTGCALKLTYLPGYHSAQFEISALWGTEIVDPRRVVRVIG